MRKEKKKREIVINDYTTHGYMGCRWGWMDVWRGSENKKFSGLGDACLLYVPYVRWVS